MNGMISRGLVCVFIALALQTAARSQDEAQNNKIEDEARAAAVARAAEAAQLKAAVDELQVKLKQARDEVQQALEQRDGQSQIAELREQLKTARAEAEKARAVAEDQRQRLAQTLLELKEHAAAVAQERDRAIAAQQAAAAQQAEAQRAGAKHAWTKIAKQPGLDRAKQAEAEAQMAQLLKLQADLAARNAAQVQSGGPVSRDENAGWHDLLNAASQALDRAHQEWKLAEMLQKLHGLGRHEEAARLEAKAHELGIRLVKGPQGAAETEDELRRHMSRLMSKAPQGLEDGGAPEGEIAQKMRAARKEAAGPDGIQSAINELRGEVQQLRMEVQGLRKLLEARPAANEGAHRALRREDLFHIRSRVAGEVVRLGSIGDDDREGRSLRAGDSVRKGQVLAVVCCDQISEKQNELIEAITTLSADQRNLEAYKEAYRSGALPERELHEQMRKVEVDQGEIRKLERTLHAWHVDEADLAAIRDQAQRDAAGDPRTEEAEYSLPWGQVKVLAPVDGVVLERNVSQGELVQLDANLFILQATNGSDTENSLQ